LAITSPSKLKGKLHTTLEQIEHGHHIFRAYIKHAFVKQYESSSPSCAMRSAPTIWPISD